MIDQGSMERSSADCWRQGVSMPVGDAEGLARVLPDVLRAARATMGGGRAGAVGSGAVAPKEIEW